MSKKKEGKGEEEDGMDYYVKRCSEQNQMILELERDKAALEGQRRTLKKRADKLDMIMEKWGWAEKVISVEMRELGGAEKIIRQNSGFEIANQIAMARSSIDNLNFIIRELIIADNKQPSICPQCHQPMDDQKEGNP